MWEKLSVALERKVVLVLSRERQETYVRHWPSWYDLSCLSGVKPQYNKPTNQKSLCILKAATSKSTSGCGQRHSGPLTFSFTTYNLFLYIIITRRFCNGHFLEQRKFVEWFFSSHQLMNYRIKHKPIPVLRLSLSWYPCFCYRPIGSEGRA